VQKSGMIARNDRI